MKLSPIPLQGRFVRLEPLVEPMREALRDALAGPDPAWDIMATSAQGERFDAWFEQALADITAGDRVAYAVRRMIDRRIAGSTSYMHIDPDARSLEIGSTFLHAEARGGAVNPDMKLAMLAHAFGAGAVRVEIRTDGRNLRSQAAIAKLGAIREGVLRKQKRLWNGEVRDTMVFSVIDEEWPPVRQRLERRLDALASPQS